MREITNKADRVGDQDLDTTPQRPSVDPSGQRGKQHVGGKRATVGESIEERTFPRVGVTHQAHREVIFGSIGHFATLSALHFGQLSSQLSQAISGQAPVNLELGFPRSSRTNTYRGATGDLPQVVPHRPQPWVGVLQLGNFNLELCFQSCGPAGKNVQDQF